MPCFLRAGFPRLFYCPDRSFSGPGFFAEQVRLGEIPTSDEHIAAFHRARELGAVWAALKQDPKGVAREVAGRLLPMLADGVLDIASLGSQAYQRAFAETLLQKIGTGGREEMLAALQSGDGLFAFYDEAHKAGSKAQLLSLAGLALGIATGGVAGLAKTTMGRVGTMIGGGAVSVTVPPALAALPEEGVKGALGSALKALVEGGALIALGIKGKGAHTSVSMGELIRSNASRLETLKGLAPRDAAALVHGVLQDNGIAGVRVAPAAVLETLQKAEKAFPALSVDPVLVALREQAQKALAEEGTLFLPADAALSEIATRLPDLADHMELQTAADRGRAAGEGGASSHAENMARERDSVRSSNVEQRTLKIWTEELYGEIQRAQHAGMPTERSVNHLASFLKGSELETIHLPQNVVREFLAELIVKDPDIVKTSVLADLGQRLFNMENKAAPISVSRVDILPYLSDISGVIEDGWIRSMKDFQDSRPKKESVSPSPQGKKSLESESIISEEKYSENGNVLESRNKNGTLSVEESVTLPSGAERVLPRKGSDGKPGWLGKEELATPDEIEIPVGQHLTRLGYNVLFLEELSKRGIQDTRTGDMLVQELGYVEIYTPITLNLSRIISQIEKKSKQAPSILVQFELSVTEMSSVAERMWSKRSAKSLGTLYFMRSDGSIYRFNRPADKY